MNETYQLPDLAYDYGALEPHTIPLLAVDAWEHAYYLQYLNAKGDFFEAVWQVVNWAGVAERLTAARRPEA